MNSKLYTFGIEGASNFTGWNQKIYDRLTPSGRKAYCIVAELHNGVKRRDGSWYLEHINRSILRYWDLISIYGSKYNKETIEKLICLHDGIEDHDDGLDRIYADYGIKVLIQVLWMSELKHRVRIAFSRWISTNPTFLEKLSIQRFRVVIGIIDCHDPNNNYTQEILKGIFPHGNWIEQWKYFKLRYDQEGNEGKRQDIFAEWVFQGMICNMPGECFLAKTTERIDNLSDIKGLRDEQGGRSYDKTLYTTSNTYLPRLLDGKYLDLYDLTLTEACRGRIMLSDVLPKVTSLTRIDS